MGRKEKVDDKMSQSMPNFEMRICATAEESSEKQWLFLQSAEEHCLAEAAKQ